ncbi:Uncharacterised protein [Serratia rubidaea]|nr:hypothetical protein [Serratia rubidaea]QPR62790.1 hypothetical protein I6G83_18540 [Serratia rubidaea]CAI0803262.1 Uncharacterised protein [Serratia rubidaea]CAI1609677.1 Uncharacterised protein [Serratia rubidaea]HAY0636201.1 hypothetical protein [Serratia rubidaea]HAY0639648.1 hypothetical protein [Serratia rubidaea]
MSRARVRVSAIVLVAIGAMFAFAWPYIKMEFAGSAYYTQQDSREYAFYTPELLKNMPRIAEHYRFEFGNVSGPEAQVFTVRFDNATDTSKIRSYLASAGYQPQSRCDVEAECWRTPQSKDVVTLIKYTSPNSVVVQIYRSPYIE